MNKKMRLLTIVVKLLYVLGILGLIINIIMVLIMNSYTDESIVAYMESVRMFSIIRPFILNVLLIVSAYSISKNKVSGIYLILAYLILAIIPPIINILRSKQFSINYVIDFIRYFAIFLVFVYLQRLKKIGHFQ